MTDPEPEPAVLGDREPRGAARNDAAPRLAGAVRPSGRAECARCGRPEPACYCAHVAVVPTRSRLLVLQHPRERDKAIGTARIAALGLPDAQIAVGVDFAGDERVRAALGDPARPPVLLYPGEGARDLGREPPRGPVTLVVIDGTWHQARSLMRNNPWLAALPRYTFAPERPSEYRIRREPKADYVSTVEAIAHALGALEGSAQRFSPLLVPFRAMVDVQLGFAARSSGGRRRLRRRGGNRAAPRLPALLTEPNLVCVAGESNGGRRDPHARAPELHELVYWTALRLADDARFEALIAPRRPLTATPMKYGRLPEAAVRGGGSVAELLAGWQAFTRPDDVICVWGHYALDLFRAEGAPVSDRIVDLRKVSGDYLRRRPGAPDALVHELALPWQPSGQGRGGERLGMLAALTRWLAARA
jgi:DTW domain-containing protein YfiP